LLQSCTEGVFGEVVVETCLTLSHLRKLFV